MSSPSVDGMGHERGLGNVLFLWSREHLLASLSRLVDKAGEVARYAHRLVVTGTVLGGTASTGFQHVAETAQRIQESGGHNKPVTVDLCVTLHPMTSFQDLDRKEQFNEAAALRELTALEQGGACHPKASREGYGPAQPYTLQNRTWVFQQTGDRGLSRPRFAAAVAHCEFLAFEGWPTSEVLGRDLEDRLRDATPMDGPRFNAIGAFRICFADQERTLHYRHRFMGQLLEANLAVVGDPREIARVKVSQSKLAEDGKSPGLNGRIMQRAFGGDNPIREKIFSTPANAVSVKGKLQAQDRHFSAVKRELQVLLKRFRHSAGEDHQDLERIVADTVQDLLTNQSPATALAGVMSIEEILQEKARSLETVISRRKAESVQVQQQMGMLRAQANEQRTLLQTVLRPARKLAIPAMMLVLHQRLLMCETDVILLEISAGVQKALLDLLPAYRCVLRSIVENVAAAMYRCDEIATAVTQSRMEHRGVGKCLEDPSRFDADLGKFEIAPGRSNVAAAGLRRFIANLFLTADRAASAEEMIQHLEPVAAQTISLPETEVTPALLNSPRREQDIKSAIQGAEPLIVLDPTFKNDNQLFYVILPGGAQNPLAPVITEMVKALHCPELPKFLSDGHINEIVFFRATLKIPAHAALSVLRSDEALSKASRMERFEAHRTPIHALLPPVALPIPDLMAMQYALMGVALGRLRKEKGGWQLVDKDGSRLSLGDLSAEAVMPVFKVHYHAVQVSTWFIAGVLERGFAWAVQSLKEAAQLPEFSKGEFPKAIQGLLADVEECAGLHHQRL